MKNEVWELRVYFWWSGGETTFFSVLLCLLFVLMPARTCQSWYKMYVLQQTHKHLYARRGDHVILRSAVFAFHLNVCIGCKYWQKSQQSWYGKTVTAFTSSWFHVNSYGVLTIPFLKLCTQLHTIYIFQPGHKKVERAQTENILRKQICVSSESRPLIGMGARVRKKECGSKLERLGLLVACCLACHLVLVLDWAWLLPCLPFGPIWRQMLVISASTTGGGRNLRGCKVLLVLVVGKVG